MFELFSYNIYTLMKLLSEVKYFHVTKQLYSKNYKKYKLK